MPHGSSKSVSSNGLSTIWLAAALRVTGDVVSGTEILPARADEANANLREAGLADDGHVVPGHTRATISTITEPIDLVFIDAEKDDDSAQFEVVFVEVRCGGLILADNVVSHDCSVYQAMLRSRSDVDTMTLPIEHGIEFTYKR